MGRSAWTKPKFLKLGLSPEFYEEIKGRSEKIAGIMQACCSDGVNTAEITKEGIMRLAILRGLDDLEEEYGRIAAAAMGCGE